MIVAGSYGLFLDDPTRAYLPSGFIMNWFGQRQGEGVQFHILAVGLAVALAIRGAGALSVDRWLARRLT